MNVRHLAVSVTIGLFAFGCSQMKQITSALANLNRLEFRLQNIEGFSLAGVDLSRLSDPSKLSLVDGINLGKAFAAGTVPARFILNIECKNPNSGDANTRQANATLKDLDWRLFIDEKLTVTGGLAKPLEIPGSKRTATIPLSVAMDLYTFFGDRGYDGMLNLALSLGGARGTTSKVKLDAMPTVTTPFGDIAYPGRLTILDKSFSGS